MACHDITIASLLGRKLRQVYSRWYNVLKVVGIEVEKQLYWKVFESAAGG